MLFANHGAGLKLHNATEHMCSNVGTAGVITEVFSEDFFVTILGLNAGLDGNQRNGETPPSQILLFCEKQGAWASNFGVTLAGEILHL